jgi:hypothetical protein
MGFWAYLAHDDRPLPRALRAFFGGRSRLLPSAALTVAERGGVLLPRPSKESGVLMPMIRP